MLVKYVKWALSPEFLFGLYLVAGNFKAAVTFIPIDLTILLLVVTIMASVYRQHKLGYKLPKYYIAPMVAFLVIQIAAVTSLAYTSGTTYTLEKTIRFIVISAWCYYGSFFLIKNKTSIWKIITGIVTVSLITGISGLLVPGEVFGTNYLSVAGITAVGSLVFVSYFIFSNRSTIKRVLSLLVGLVLAVSMMDTGGRLPVIVFSLVLLSLPFMFIKIKRDDIIINKNIKYLFLLLVTTALALPYFISNGYGQTLMYRLNVMFNESGGGASVSGRLDRLNIGLQMAQNSNLMGMGINSFPSVYNGLPTDTPHVIFVEILAELGLVALLAFMLIVSLSIYRSFRAFQLKKEKLLVYTVLVVWMYLLANSFASSGLISSKLLFAFLSITIVLPRILKTDNLELMQTAR